MHCIVTRVDLVILRFKANISLNIHTSLWEYIQTKYNKNNPFKTGITHECVVADNEHFFNIF